MPEPTACAVPLGSMFVPAPTQAGGVLVSESDGAGGFRPVWLYGPQTPNNQDFKFGTGGPYWANSGGFFRRMLGLKTKRTQANIAARRRY